MRSPSRPSSSTSAWIGRALGLAVMLGACRATPPEVSDPAAIIEGTTTDAGTTGSTGAIDPEDPHRRGTFIDDPDLGTSECDEFAQDCPAGQKCTYAASYGYSSWDTTLCVPIAPDPDGPGEPCTVEGDPNGGIDTCELGAICYDADPETRVGICVEICTGTHVHPFCPDPNMLCAGREYHICLPTCCPLEQDCDQGEGCYANEVNFSCANDGSGDTGQYGDPCTYINQCAPGLMCTWAGHLPDCADSYGCCTTFCEVGSSTCALLDPDLECIPRFEPDEAPPGLERVGACLLPDAEW